MSTMFVYWKALNLKHVREMNSAVLICEQLSVESVWSNVSVYLCDT
jgi:hypothetical protein